MKKHIKTILYCGLLFWGMSLVSCTSFLDKAPNTSIDPDAAFKNFTNFQGWTEALYNCIPDFANRDQNNFFNLGDEEMWQLNATTQNAVCWQFDLGNFWCWQKEYASSWMDCGSFATDNDRSHKGLWPGCWYGIRLCNLGLLNLSKFTGTEEEKNLLAGQFYFFRGWFHFQLIQYFGGLPYITKILPSDQKLTLPRLSYKQCADSVAKDLQKAYELLPGDWDKTVAGQTTLSKNELRINKWMALAYIGKNYLWAGSPLMNMVSGGNEEYNREYCKKAAEAFGTLLQASENGSCPYKLVPFSNYSDLVYTNGQNGRMPGSATVGGVYYLEAIFRGPNWGGSDLSLNKQYLAAGSVLQDRSWSLYPTANYVNYFGMANGMPINDQNKADVADPGAVNQGHSGYDTNYPWKNRDPRFYINFGIDCQLQVKSSASSAAPYKYANLYSGGNYRDPSKGSNTGYLLMKFDPLGFNKYDNAYNNNQIHPAWVRLADVYLMYAEAVAQGYNSLTATATTFTAMNAVDAVNKIRDRAGVGHVHPKYLSSVESFMPELRRERAVELAYEGHRFNDLRRWHLLAKYPYNVKTGIFFDRAVPETNHAKPTNNFLDKNVPQNNKILNLQEKVIFTREFTEKHYWLPLKRADVNMYLEFAQNPGW